MQCKAETNMRCTDNTIEGEEMCRTHLEMAVESGCGCGPDCPNSCKCCAAASGEGEEVETPSTN